MIDDFEIIRSQPLRSQIADYLRERILQGHIKPGSCLPSTRILAEKWGTQTANVHAALTSLVQEGLITRKNGVGTFVNLRRRMLETILIYERCNHFGPTSKFQCLLLSLLCNELIARNIKYRIIYANQTQDPFKEIAALVEKNMIQGIILPSTTRVERPWFEKLPVPFSCITSAKIKNRVTMDYQSMAEKVAEGLASQGCTRAGMLLSFSNPVTPTESGEKERRNAIVAIKKSLTEKGIEVRDEWIYTSDKSFSEEISDYDRYAFDGFNAIWRSNPKPDGLFVFTDDLISGTLIALMGSRLRVPEDIKLLLHRNSNFPPLCPVQCRFIENCMEDIAKGLVDLVVNQYQGRKIEQCVYGYRLI